MLAVGIRLSIRQVGYDWKTWARAAKVVMVDVDPAELKKPTLHIDLPVCADAKDFLTALETAIAGEALPLNPQQGWRELCESW